MCDGDFSLKYKPFSKMCDGDFQRVRMRDFLGYRSETSSDSPTNSDMLDDLLIAVAQKVIQFLKDEAEMSKPRRTRQPRLERYRIDAHNRLVSDYFAENLLYDDEQF
ncbi:hypothetical protein Hdeb2414_s0088g00786171 [Helianthus debilis subsp. tardiflorus]